MNSIRHHGAVASVRGWGVVLVLFAFATAWNLTKAYHIDDTAYLEIAQWIAGHPAHPMSGTVYWSNVPEPIHRINQPHLYMYAMAAWGSMFGWSEIAMHSLMALFALAAIVLMHRLSRSIVPDQAWLPTSLVAASPAFVVGQNTFVDVPMLAMWLLFFTILLARRESGADDRARYVLAGVICGLAILVKYTSLVLVPAFIVDGLLRRRAEAGYGIAVAIAIVAAWCAFNYWDYGGIHMLTRTAGLDVRDPRKWILCLGATAPFSFALAAAWLGGKRGLVARIATAVMLGGIAAGVAIVVASYLGAIAQRVSDGAFVAFFVLGGAMLVVLAAMAVPRMAASMPAADVTKWMLAYWAVAAAGFILLLAPFIAMRHVLLALPPIVLLAHLAIGGRVRRLWSVVALVTTFASTSIVAAGDRWYADIYRNEAGRLRDALPASAKVWTTGHWGWQWYAQHRGMTEFVPGESRLTVGDYIVYPQNVHRQLLPPDLKTIAVQEVAVAPANWIQAFAAPNAGFYATSDFGQLPWAVRRGPIEIFKVLRIEATTQP